jgi:RecA/RadA recombinase
VRLDLHERAGSDEISIAMTFQETQLFWIKGSESLTHFEAKDSDPLMLDPLMEHAQLLARAEVRHLSLAALPIDRATTNCQRQFTEADHLAAQRGLEGQLRLIRALDAAGAGLLVGTDLWLAGYAFDDELDLHVRAG